MRLYSFGLETVPTSLSGDLIVGSVKKENYEIMLAKINGEDIENLRFLSGVNDWEGHAALMLSDGYLIGGAVEGRATPQGGDKWRAYIARVDNELNLLWERKFSVKGNDAVYSILPIDNGFLIGGETGWREEKGFFLATARSDGEITSIKTFGFWEDVLFANLIKRGEKVHLIGSVKDGVWKIKDFVFNDERSFEEEFGEGVALTAAPFRDHTLLTGYYGEKLFVSLSSQWRTTLGNGTGTAIMLDDEEIIVGGELDGSAILFGLNSEGELLWKRELWHDGWVENVGRGVALGVKNSGEKVLMAIEILS